MTCEYNDNPVFTALDYSRMHPERYPLKKLVKAAEFWKSKGRYIDLMDITETEREALFDSLIKVQAKIATMDSNDWDCLQGEDRAAVAWVQEHFRAFWDAVVKQILKDAFSGKVRLEIETGIDPDGGSYLQVN